MKNRLLKLALLMLAAVTVAGCRGQVAEAPPKKTTETQSESANTPASAEMAATDNSGEPTLDGTAQEKLGGSGEDTKASEPTSPVATASSDSSFPWPTDDMLAESTTPPSSEQKESKSGKLDLIGMFPQWEHAKNLKGDVAAGREIYTRLGLDSPFSCQACHGFDKDDTMEVDSLGLIRVGHSIYAASHRTNTKNSGIRNAALGGNICVLHFFHGKSPGMAAQELAHLDAFLKTGGAANHPTAQNIPYDRMTYPVPPAVLTGGDVAKGKAIAMSRCVSCHAVGDVEAKYGAVGVSLAAGESDYLTLDELAHRIRNIDDKNNDYMPGFSNLVLTDEEMIDLLAWLTKK